MDRPPQEDDDFVESDGATDGLGAYRPPESPTFDGDDGGGRPYTRGRPAAPPADILPGV